MSIQPGDLLPLNQVGFVLGTAVVLEGDGRHATGNIASWYSRSSQDNLQNVSRQASYMTHTLKTEGAMCETTRLP